MHATIILPLFSSPVTAGFPSPAQDYTEDKIDLNKVLIQHPEATFCLRVQGESMTGASIREGDVLIVDRSLLAVDGSIIVASIGNDFTVKRFRTRAGRVWLESENPKYKPIELAEDDESRLWGIVTWIIHRAR